MYNFSVLNSTEFEFLAKDVLENELKVSFQIFKKGWDEGVDLRYSKNRENTIVVQAKHYHSTPYSGLLSELKKEKEKILDLKETPERYILFTSFSLTKKQVDKIFDLMSPYIRDTNDIYGLERIVEALKNNKKIEEKYFKLWLASSNVLTNIIKRGEKGKSEFYREKILKKLSLYVPTQNFSKAIKKLNENRFIIITGDPGVGKTTISYLLICNLLADGYELIYINDKIKEAEGMLSPDPEEKQVIFFDDFLGANIAEIMNPRNTESAIVGLIERVTNLKGKFLILTTRTTILNQANSRYEKLKSSNFSSISKYQVEIKQYSRVDKARILYNHLFHSDLRKNVPAYYNTFFEDKNYYKVIDHWNFSPRLIEFITTENKIRSNGKMPRKALDFILNHLNNPSEIWSGAYENQLSDEDRFLLTTLFSLGGHNVEQQTLEEAYQARLKFEISENGIKMENDSFNKSIKKLLDGFIRAINESGITTFSYLNPSVGDFIINYLKERSQEKLRILNSVIFMEQFAPFYPENEFTIGYLPLSSVERVSYFEKFIEVSKRLKFSENSTPKSKPIEILKIYFSFFSGVISTEHIEPWVKRLKGQEIAANQFSSVMTIFPKVTEMSLDTCFHNEWDNIIAKLFEYCNYPEDFNNVRELFDLCKIDLRDYLSRTENFEVLKNSISRAFSEHFMDNHDLSDYAIRKINEYAREGYRKYAISTIEDSAWDLYNDFVNDTGFSDYENIIGDLDIDSEAVFDSILKDSYYDDYDDYEGPYIDRDGSSGKETDEIDRLFQP